MDAKQLKARLAEQMAIPRPFGGEDSDRARLAKATLIDGLRDTLNGLDHSTVLAAVEAAMQAVVEEVLPPYEWAHALADLEDPPPTERI